MREIKILFIGGMFFKNAGENIALNSTGPRQDAASLLQWNYVKGMENNPGHRVDILNAYFIGWFPKNYKHIRIKKEQIRRVDAGGRKAVETGFINLPVIDQFTKYAGFKKEIRKWLRRYKNDIRYVISYGFFYEQIAALAYAKKTDPDVRTALIIPDLPEFMNQTDRFMGIKRILTGITYACYRQNRCYIDCYSLITKYIARRLRISSYVVIEGMVDEGLPVENHAAIQTETYDSHDNRFIFMYSGSLYEAAGVRNLLDSFMKLECDNAQLWISGDGVLKPYVIKCAETDRRIRYLGTLPQSRILQIQKQVDCLVNPRNDSELTRYSFPSKNMEYLLSGVSVIAKKLKGMPGEYRVYFFEFQKDRDLPAVMKYVMELAAEERKRRAQSAMEFVRNTKNCKVQTRKLLQLLGRGAS